MCKMSKGWEWFFFFFKKKTAYEMRISDWSSDVCSSDLAARPAGEEVGEGKGQHHAAHRDHGGEQQGKPEHAAEEGAEEALVVVEDEVDAVEAALLAPEEADRDHGAEGNDEEYHQHSRRKDQRQMVGQRARPVASHCSKIGKASGREREGQYG